MRFKASGLFLLSLAASTAAPKQDKQEIIMNTFAKSLVLAALALTVGVTSANAMILVAKPKATASSSNTDCTGEMGFLRSYKVGQVRNVDDARVYIQPICQETSLNGRDDVGALFVEGNVGGLRGTIGENETLSAALWEKDYSSDDVVGIRLNNEDQVILYVHKR
jgi:hypothetical protein